ncbi:hypothetical protein ACNO2P_004636, partial [Escherichia coli]
SNVITIGDDGTVGVAVSVRNNLKTRTSLGPVSILRGEEHLDIVIKDILFCFFILIKMSFICYLFIVFALWLFF